MNRSIALLTTVLLITSAIPAFANRRKVVKLPAPKVLTTVVGKPSLSGR